MQIGASCAVSPKAGLNAVLVRGRPKCQTLAICMLIYGEVHHHTSSGFVIINPDKTIINVVSWHPGCTGHPACRPIRSFTVFTIYG